MEGSVDRAAFGDFEEAGFLVVIQGTDEFDFPVDAIDLTRF